MAPLHYRVGPDVGGSELSWAYEILRSIWGLVGRIDAVTADAPGLHPPANVRVFETRPNSVDNYFTGAIGPRLRFVGEYARTARRLIRANRYDILHHVLPWSPSTFNPIILSRGWPAGLPTSTRVVMGPVQYRHEMQFADEADYNRFTNANEQKRAGRFPLAAVLEQGAEALCKATLRRADAIVALTPAARDAVRPLCAGVPIHVIPAGLDYEHFPAVQRSRKDVLTIVTASYLLLRKGNEFILRAVARLAREGIRTHCIIAGAGPQLEALKQEAADLGVAESVEFPGLLSRDAITEVYARGDVYVSMSWAETFGVAVLEAMSTGLPVVSAANVGATQIVEDGVTGYLVPKGDDEALAAALRRYAANPDLARRQGAAAAAVIRSDYDWKIIGSRYADVYSSLLENA